MILVVGFWPKIRRLGSSDSQIEKNPVGFFMFGLHKQGHSFLRSKHTNLKVEIERHRKQPTAIAYGRVSKTENFTRLCVLYLVRALCEMGISQVRPQVSAASFSSCRV